MIKNWVIYILALIGALVFFLFYQMWFAWYCVLMLLLLPPIALFMALVAAKGYKAHISAPRSIKIGDNASLTISTSRRKFAICSFSRIDLTVTESMTGKRMKQNLFVQGNYDAKVPMDTRHCGSFQYKISGIRVFDLFGLFGFRRKAKASCEAVIQPVPQMPDAMPSMNGFKAKTLRKSNSPYSEIYDVREYIMGDPIKNIHWKASAKKDSLLVKEPQEECYGHARVFLALSEDRDIFDRRMGELLFTSNYFLSRDIPHKIRVLPPMKREVAFDIQSQRDLDMALLRILRMKIPKEETDAKK